MKYLGEKRPQRKLKRGHFHLLLALSGAAGVTALAFPSHEAEATRQTSFEQPLPVTVLPADKRLTFELPLPLVEEDIIDVALPTSKKPQWQEVKVKSGDNLSLIFSRLDISARQMFELLEADQEKQLKRLRPGETLLFSVVGEELLGLQYQIDRTHKLTFSRGENGFSAEQHIQNIEIRQAHAAGIIENSLYLAGQKAGLSDNTIMELVGIFGWDIDFALDIRQGDHFSIIYEEQFINGEKLDNGHIIAAEFVNQGTSYRAVRYTDPEGNSNYYSPDGHSMRKAFLRSPVDFRRISSRFTKARWHPVLGKKRPHRGVDYSASIGTPIKAAGDGKIIFRGTKGGYGKTVILQHGGKYTTLYAHLSNYKRGQKSGSRVKQGQIIGYVGKSGLATGPHLHYEFRVNGVHRNPLTVKLPNAAPIKKAYREDFLGKSTPLLAQIDLYRQIQLASNQ
jgi:murein DD-endopeptidase MepM/ murein hydrolase activator NlpD